MRLIRENGFRPNSHYYHLGDGGHAYHYNMKTSSTIYFKCVNYEQGCRGRAVLRLGGRFRHSQAHNHPPDPHFVGERHFRENVLHQITNARYVDFKDILNQARRNQRYHKNVRSKMNKRRLGSAMSRVRLKSYPPIPGSLRELTRQLLNNDNVTKTVDSLDNLYAGSIDADDGSHHVAFISRRMLNFMANVKLIQGDGTFRPRPALPPSSQCFVLVTTWRNCVVPIGWVLMESRTLAAYEAVFRLLRTVCPAFNPEVVISDWEYAQQRAWATSFPNARIQGCLWHLSRAFVRKAGKLGLIRFKTVLPDLLDFVRRACAICLLPEDYFDAGLQVLSDEARENNIVVAYLLVPFFQYVEDRWIHHPRRREWMTLFNSMLRTNNSCEAHNNMLSKELGGHPSNIYQFLEGLARIEHNTNLDVFHMQQGNQVRRKRRWRSVYHDRQLKALGEDIEMDLFHDERQTISEFLSRAAHLIHNEFEEHLAREQ